jgi:hypothetical protein
VLVAMLLHLCPLLYFLPSILILPATLAVLLLLLLLHLQLPCLQPYLLFSRLLFLLLLLLGPRCSPASPYNISINNPIP